MVSNALQKSLAPFKNSSIHRILVLLGAFLLTFFVAQPARSQETTFNGTTFLSGSELASLLMQNGVRIRAFGKNSQHGFGLIVGWSEQWLYIVTARHVVSFKEVGAMELPIARIEVDFCAKPEIAAVLAEFLPFDAKGEDAALLRVPRPPNFQPVAGALEVAEKIEPGQETWVLGYNAECRLHPSIGRASSWDEQRGLLEAIHPVRGGTSGAALMVGGGIAAIVFDSDQVRLNALSTNMLETRVRAAGVDWSLLKARNILPTDPNAARIDLSETLNQYTFAVRNVHDLLLQPSVPRNSLTNYVNTYNATIRRFRDAKDKYDGTFAKNQTLSQWHRLRDDLWKVHLEFWEVNEEIENIWKNRKTPPETTVRLRALEPALQALERDVSSFLKILDTRSPQ